MFSKSTSVATSLRAAETAVGFRVFHNAHDFFQLVLGFIHAGHVVEGDAGVGFDIDLGLALAEVHEAAADALLAAEPLHREDPDADEDHRRKHPAEEILEEGVFDDAGEFHVVLREILGQRRIDTGSDELLAAVFQRLLECALDGVVGDRYFAQLAGFEQTLELAVGQRLDGAHLGPDVVQGEDRKQREDEIPETELRFLLHGPERAR